MHFVRKFLRGQIERETYTQMLAQLYFVYAEMEELLQRHRDDPVYGAPRLQYKRVLEYLYRYGIR